MTTEHRKAPRRKITMISRVGTWGAVKYQHTLECGHVEIRERKSTAPKLACAWCLRVVDKRRDLLALNPAPANDLENIDEDIITSLEAQAKVKAEISKRLGLPLDAIDVTINEPTGQRVVTIFLSRGDVSKMTGQ